MRIGRRIAQALVSSAEGEVERAQARLNRARDLYERGLISTPELAAEGLVASIPAKVNYRESTDPLVECATCSYYDSGHCTMFDADVSPGYVCDEWAKIVADHATNPTPATRVNIHNAAVRKADKDSAELERALVEVLTPILEKAGEDAARAFTQHATKSVIASAAVRLAGEYGPARARELLTGLELSAAAPAPNTTMIAVKPRPDEAAAVALPDGEPSEFLHVTLAVIGAYDGPLEDLAALLRPVGANNAGLTGIVGGVGAFGDNGNGPPIILLPSVPGLVELRVAITDALVDGEVAYYRNHGFVPHLTVAYGSPGGDEAGSEDAGGPAPVGGQAARGMSDLRPDAVAAVSDGEGGRGAASSASAGLGGSERAAPGGMGRPSHVPGETLPQHGASGGEAGSGARAPALAAPGDLLDPRDAVREERQAGMGRLPGLRSGSYAAVSSEDPRIGFPLHFDSIWIVRGDTEAIEVPLVGPPPITASAYRALIAAPEEADPVVDRIREVAAEHQPESGTYGDTAWNSETATVFWNAADWSTNEEVDAATEAFLGIEGVKVFDSDAEVGMEPYTRDGWEVVWRSGDSLTAAPDPPDWQPPYPNQVVDVEALAKQLRGKTDPVRQGAVASVMKDTLEGVGIDFDVTNPLTAKVLASAASQVTNIAETTQLNVMRSISVAYDQGLSIPSTAALIRSGMAEAAPWRATLIARTELAGAVNGGSLAAVQIVSKATGDTYLKVWMTAPGAIYPRHEEYDGLDGQTVPLSGKFSVGADTLDHPGDPAGSPEEVCNCRCAMSYETPGGDLTDADVEE